MARSMRRHSSVSLSTFSPFPPADPAVALKHVCTKAASNASHKRILPLAQGTGAVYTPLPSKSPRPSRCKICATTTSAGSRQRNKNSPQVSIWSDVGAFPEETQTAALAALCAKHSFGLCTFRASRRNFLKVSSGRWAFAPRFKVFITTPFLAFRPERFAIAADGSAPSCFPYTWLENYFVWRWPSLNSTSFLSFFPFFPSFHIFLSCFLPFLFTSPTSFLGMCSVPMQH